MLPCFWVNEYLVIITKELLIANFWIWQGTGTALNESHHFFLHTDMRMKIFNTLRPRQDGRHFPDDIFKCIFLNENVWISIKISLKFVPKGPINNIPALFQIMASRRPGNNTLSEPMVVNLLTHICVTRPQWVKAEATALHLCQSPAISIYYKWQQLLWNILSPK